MFCCAAAQLMAFPIIEPNGFIWEYEYLTESPNSLYARRHYTYDEQGRVTRYEQWYSYDVDSIPSAIFEYTYGPYGMLTRVVSAYSESKHAYYQSGKWKYFYDENGYYLYSYSEAEPTAVENTSVNKPMKVMQDGRVLIRRGNRWYDTMGRPAEKPY